MSVGSLVVRALDFGPEGLSSMPVPPNTLRIRMEYVLVKSVGPKDLWAESRVQGTGVNFPPIQFHAKIVEVEIDSGAIYRNVLSSLQEFHRAKSYCRLPVKNFEDAELQALLDEDDGQTQEHLAEQLNVDQSTVSRRLKTMGKIKVGRWVPHELTDRQQENRKIVCEMLLAHYKRVISPSYCDWR
ncbi:mariner Mos1 transposase [Trichonephila clavipes]|nr:mariner Mos1 transposase [Trichonephila clavipes]